MGTKSENFYLANWENYYRSMSSKPEDIPWDVDPQLAIGLDIKVMRKFFNPHLAVVDVGCGIGTQTQLLTEEFQKVIGTDISNEAVKIAADKFSSPNLSFQQLDILNKEQVQKLSEELGDCNVYMRGTLQQILINDRDAFVESLALLLGRNGILYFIELSDDAKNYFFRLKLKLGDFPKQLKRVLTEKVTELVGVNESELDKIFPPDTFSIELKGSSTIALKLDDNHYADVPATYAVISVRKLVP
jgi:SAM-dependent methyltransferase